MRTTGQKRVLSNALKQLKLDDQINQANRQLENIRNIFIQQGTPLDQGQKDTLNALIAQRDVYHAQLEILKEQMNVGARIGQAINQGLESGLQTNIFDFLTGKEKSFKDAILNTAKSVLESVAKSISEMFTEKIMGAIGIETKAQKTQRLILEAHTTGATVLGDTIRTEGDRMAASIDAAINKRKEEGTAVTEEAPSGPVAVRDPNRGVRVKTEAQTQLEIAMNKAVEVAEENKDVTEQGLSSNGSIYLKLEEIRFLLDKSINNVTPVTTRGTLEKRKIVTSADELEDFQKPPISESNPVSLPPVLGGVENTINLDNRKPGAAGSASNPLITKTFAPIDDAPAAATPTSSVSTTSDRVAKANAKSAVDAGKTQVEAANTAVEAGKEQAKAGFQMNKAALGMGVAGIGMIAAGGEQKKAGFVMMAAAIAQQIAASMQAASGGSGGLLAMFGMAAAGGVFSDGKKRSYQPGGIASGPTSGYPVMLHGTEAVVPLPDGKSIPVQMSGGGGTNNVVVNVNMETGEAGTEKREGKDMSELGRVVAVAVQAELQHQKRPGGILSPFGAS